MKTLKDPDTFFGKALILVYCLSVGYTHEYKVCPSTESHLENPTVRNRDVKLGAGH